MSETVQDLKSLYGEEEKIKIAGVNVIIKQIKFGDLPTILSLVDKIFGEIPKAINNTEIALLMNKALAKDFNSVVHLVSILTDLTEDQVKKLNMASTVKIIEGIVGVNIDFLFQQVLPSVKEMTSKLSGSFKSKNLFKGDTQKSK